VAKERNINDIITDSFLGKLNHDDQARLDAWLGQEAGHRLLYARMSQRADVTSRYRRFKAINPQKAWKRFKNKHLVSINSFSTVLRRFLPYAAAVIVFAIVLVLTNRTGREEKAATAVRLPAEVEQTIVSTQRHGRMKATVEYSSHSGRLVTYSQALSLATPDADMSSQMQPNDTATMRTRSDSEFWLTLDDGSRVHLSTNTTLIYPVKFLGKIRTVWLDGEAYFFVRHDSESQFRVITAQGIVTDMGTEFFVSTTNNSGKTEVTLVKGSVSVSSLKGGERKLIPGEKATIGDGPLLVTKTETESIQSWNTGNFVFTNCRLDKLMDVLGQWYGISVIFKDNEARRIMFSGIIEKTDDISPALTAIQSTTGLNMVRHGNVITINK